MRVLVHLVHKRNYLFGALTRLCGYIDRLEIVHKLQVLFQLAFELVYGVSVLFD